ncbi:MAG TPA: hypothetical protein VFW04_11035 [Gemmatimonadaceae bacterium]|nr:hypothetical protein [Gemmatimonadaceae bacterium]
MSTKGGLDPAKIERFADERLEAFRDSPTLAELVALAPVQFCALFLEAIGRPVGPYRVFGCVLERDDLTHVIYRAQAGRYRGSIQVDVLQARCRNGPWRLVPGREIISGIMLSLDRPRRG